jgi:hypothetical protein
MPSFQQTLDIDTAAQAKRCRHKPCNYRGRCCSAGRCFQTVGRSYLDIRWRWSRSVLGLKLDRSDYEAIQRRAVVPAILPACRTYIFERLSYSEYVSKLKQQNAAPEDLIIAFKPPPLLNITNQSTGKTPLVSVSFKLPKDRMGAKAIDNGKPIALDRLPVSPPTPLCFILPKRMDLSQALLLGKKPTNVPFLQ